MSSAPHPAADRQTLIIRPRQGMIGLNFAELWRYRELFGFFVWRDILVRYKQTVLGILWAFLQPLVTVVIFSILFGRIGNFPTKGYPYPVVALAALLPWQFFSTALADSSTSLLAAANMITKVYFPRLIVPSSAVLSGTVDFVIGFVILLVVQLWYHVPIRPEILLLPFFFAYAVLIALSAAVWLSSVSAKYRDVKYVVPFITRMGLYACPVAFISDVVPERWRLLYNLNPMVAVIDGFRRCILGPAFHLSWGEAAPGLLLTLAILSSGLVYFRNTERGFADVI